MTAKFALLFPGQGSQRIGMGAELRTRYEPARRLFERASQTLGYDLAALCEHGPAETLARTVFTQPALYVTSCAALEALRTLVQPLRPCAVAGHSVGEYAALYAAGAVAFEEGLRLVRARAGLMDAAAQSRPGAMAAVLGLDVEAVEKGCRDASDAGVVVVANDNCPGQVVISGDAAAVEKAEGLLKERGARRIVHLPVSGGFHSPLMETAMSRMEDILRQAEIRDPVIPVVSNVTADYCSSAACIRQNLARQIGTGVRWRESMQRLAQDGVTLFVELGCGDVLTGLMKRMGFDAQTCSAQDAGGIEAAAQRIALHQHGGATTNEA